MAATVSLAKERSILGFSSRVPKKESLGAGVTMAAIRVFENFVDHVMSSAPARTMAEIEGEAIGCVEGRRTEGLTAPPATGRPQWRNRFGKRLTLPCEVNTPANFCVHP